MLFLEQMWGEPPSTGNLNGTGATSENVLWNACPQRDSGRSHPRRKTLGFPSPSAGGPEFSFCFCLSQGAFAGRVHPPGVALWVPSILPRATSAHQKTTRTTAQSDPNRPPRDRPCGPTPTVLCFVPGPGPLRQLYQVPPTAPSLPTKGCAQAHFSRPRHVDTGSSLVLMKAN